MSGIEPIALQEPNADSTDDTAELLAGAQRGSGEMFARLMLRFRPMIWGLAWRMTLDHDDAWDVCQQMVTRIWRALPKYRPEQHLAGWIRKVAVREGLRWLEQNKNRCRTILLDDLDAPPPDLRVENDAPRELMAGERRERIERAMRHLSPSQRTAVSLRFFDDMSLIEIAGAMECSEGAVKQHLFRAMEKLRRAMKKDVEP
ncbi:RNA polymerase sigma factor [bacterium]|nr:RNA polymerase sigma factor [bacterium]